MTPCFACANGVYEECTNLQPIPGDPDHFMPCYNLQMTQSPQLAVSNGEKRAPGRPMLDNSKVTDITSTGRKRAAMLYPITEGMTCEWAGLLYAGGGVQTIIGCAGNVLSEERGKYARHHGPDKNVLENRPGNVHLICPTCHVHWHALNDKYYGERPADNTPFLPDDYEVLEHDPFTKASDEERAADAAWWALNPAKRSLESD